MVGDLSLWLGVIPSILLLTGVFTLAIWAARQPDRLAELIERLTSKTH